MIARKMMSDITVVIGIVLMIHGFGPENLSTVQIIVGGIGSGLVTIGHIVRDYK